MTIELFDILKRWAETNHQLMVRTIINNTQIRIFRIMKNDEYNHYKHGHYNGDVAVIYSDLNAERIFVRNEDDSPFSLFWAGINTNLYDPNFFTILDTEITRILKKYPS